MTKPIIVNEKNREKMEKWLSEVQKRSKERTITVDDIFSTCRKVENRLEISKRSMEGIRVYADCNAQRFPKAYKYQPQSTQFSLKMEKGKWRLTNIERYNCNRYNQNTVLLDIPESAKQALIGKYSKF